MDVNRYTLLLLFPKMHLQKFAVFSISFNEQKLRVPNLYLQALTNKTLLQFVHSLTHSTKTSAQKCPWIEYIWAAFYNILIIYEKTENKCFS